MENSMKKILSLILALTCGQAMAGAQEDIAFMLQAKNPPKGVVFEVATGDENFLARALPEIEAYSQKLREKYPAIDIALVSHGQEEFALLSENAPKFTGIHDSIKKLTQDEIPVTVCGTHAAMQNKTASDFPTYIEVAETGPKKIRDYQRQGYALVRITEP
jgi:intracellular sulfur oxidation DsrE/DsrF family protein